MDQEEERSKATAAEQSREIVKPVEPVTGNADVYDSSTESTPSQPEPVPYEEYAAMTRKVNQYRREVVRSNNEVEKLNGKVHRYKDISFRWKEYADKVYAKYKEQASASNSRPITPSSDILPPALMVKNGFIPPDPDSSSVMNSSPVASPKPTSRPQSKSGLLRTSVMATGGIPTPSTTKDDAPMRESEAKDTSTRYIRIKSEPPSSPILVSPPKRSLQRVQPLDLNNVENTADTPHRRRIDARIQSHRTLTRKNTLNSMRRERSSSPPLGDDVLPEVQSDDDLPRRNLLPTLTRADSDPNVAVEEDIYNEIVSPELAQQPGSAAATSRKSGVLSPLDSNKRVLPRTDDGIIAKKRKSNESRGGAHAIHLLAEDGTSPKRRKRSDGKPPTMRADFNGRLNHLLNQPSPARPRLSPGSLPTPKSLPRPSNLNATSSAPTAGSKDLSPKPCKSKERPAETNLDINAKHTPRFSPKQPLCDLQKMPERVDTPSTTIARTAEPFKPPPLNAAPLRSRPLSELHLSDFKLNPLQNQGLDFAFVESLRSREQRHQAHSCTDPRCCGPVMQALSAELQITPSIPPLPTSEIPYGVSSEDARILKEYLGSGYNAESISNMPAVQQHDLIMQARTRLAAERLGRHRVQHQRHQTPSGFWNPDMPTTQELEKDREEARRMERRKVEERWREAMREGGIWRFRDE